MSLPVNRGEALTRLFKGAIVTAIVFVLCGAAVFVWWHYVAQQFHAALPESTIAKLEQLSDVEKLRNVAVDLARDRARIDRDVNNILSAAIDLAAFLCILVAGYATFVAIRIFKIRKAEGGL